MRSLFLVVMLVASAAAERPRWETLPAPPPMPAATSTGFVDTTNGAKLYYATYGKPDAAPVILLHGGLGNSDHFGFQLPALTDTHRVIAIDSRGQGRSTLGKRTKLSYHVMANDVLAVMDALKVPKAALVGWSDGGAIALDIAINHPKRVDRLFVFGTNYHASGGKPRTKSTSTFTAYAVRCKREYAKLSKTPRAYEAAIAALRPIWRSKGGFTKDQLRSIRVPTVVADGEHDEIIRLDHIREMAQLIPNAKLVIFDDTSHFALWQDPQAFNAALREFLGAK